MLSSIAEQNARLVKNADNTTARCFAGEFLPGISAIPTWRKHSTSLGEHFALQKRKAKVVLWAHNSHLGDARATQMGRAGEWNVGQLVRQKHGRDCVLVGFTTYTGTVTAASNWGGPAERKTVRPAMPGSTSRYSMTPGYRHSCSPCSHDTRAAMGLCEPMLERAIGVVYLPESEHSLATISMLVSQTSSMRSSTSARLGPSSPWSEPVNGR